MKTLLIIEDEAAIRDMLRFALSSEKFTLMEAETVSDALKRLAEKIPDIIILDWMLPDKSGIDFIKWIKRKDSLKDIPIIMLTAKAEEAEKIQALTVGADDYITKPFSTLEIIARIKAVLRRGLLASPDNEIKFGRLALNTFKNTVKIDDQLIKLLPLEYKLLYFLATHPNRIYLRDQLINHVWGGGADIDDRTVDVQIKRLRSKLKPYHCSYLIKTIRGSGYLFSLDEYEK